MCNCVGFVLFSLDYASIFVFRRINHWIWQSFSQNLHVCLGLVGSAAFIKDLQEMVGKHRLLVLVQDRAESSEFSESRRVSKK